MAGYTQGWKHSGKAVDWDNVSVSAPKAPPPGLYDLKLIEVTPTETKGGNGKPQVPMIKIRAEIVKAHDGANDEAVGRTVFDNWVFTQEGAFKVKNFCMIAGKKPPETVDYDDISEFATSCEGEVVSAMLDNRTYEGKTNANVRYYGEEAPSDERNGNGNGGGRESHPPRAARGKGKGR